jgi:Nickel/cobalt transporter regulator
MSKVVISLLLASAAASPAIAGPHNGFGRQEAREERAQARDEARSERSESRPSVTARQAEPQAQPRAQFVQRSQGSRPERIAYQGNGAAARYANNAARNAFAAQREQAQQRFQRQQDPRFRPSNRPVPPVMRNPRPGGISNVPRPGTQPPPQVFDGQRAGQGHWQGHWNQNWRNDNRYNWHDYRRHHRSLFHFGFYFDPFNWGYQPFSIGSRLWPAYYGNQYWINDPWMYRLPYAPPGYVWIRYWNDAMLVDTYSGTVMDVIPGFFW